MRHEDNRPIDEQDGHSYNYELFKRDPSDQYHNSINDGSINQGEVAKDFPQYTPKSGNGSVRRGQFLSLEEVKRGERRFWSKRSGYSEIHRAWEESDRQKTFSEFKKAWVASKRGKQIQSRKKS